MSCDHRCVCLSGVIAASALMLSGSPHRGLSAAGSASASDARVAASPGPTTASGAAKTRTVGVTQAAQPRAGGTVRDFGAVGDGKTDDTAAIQRAVDSAIGDIRFPAGDYRILKPVVVELSRVGRVAISGDGAARLTMAGAGPALNIVGSHRGTADLATFQDGVYRRERMPVVDGLEILGDHPDASGIALTGAMQATLTRLLIHNVRHAIHLPAKNRNIIISECHLYYNRGVGVYLDNIDLHQINITNCHIMHNEGGGIVVSGGDVRGNVRNLQIVGCDIESNMAAGRPPTANILFDCSQTQAIGEGAIVGCSIQHSSPDLAPGCANIRIIGRDAEDPITNFSVAGNTISDVDVNVHLDRARGVAFTGNTIFMGYSLDLLIERSSDIIVANNTFDRSPADVRQIQRRGHRTLRGVMLRDSCDCILSGNQIKDAHQKRAALVVERCRRLNIADCSVYYSEGPGVLLEDVEQVRLSGCMVMRNNPAAVSPVAAALTRGKHNLLLGNLFEGAVKVAPQTAILEHNLLLP
jgi:hypothetical protein